MKNANASGINKPYIIFVSVFTFILPAICSATAVLLHNDIPFTFELAGKWFIFSAVGLRFFVAGIKQTTDPAFTAKQIFHIDNPGQFSDSQGVGLCQS